MKSTFPTRHRGGELLVPVHGQIDEDIQRAIAKIAFNYLAKTKGADFVLQKRFDKIREFINGKDYYPLVKPIPNEAFGTGSAKDKPLLMHVFIYERTNDTLRARISLFNQGISYEVILSTEMGPIFYEVTSGHVCDPIKQEIKPLGHVSEAFLRSIYL